MKFHLGINLKLFLLLGLVLGLALVALFISTQREVHILISRIDSLEEQHQDGALTDSDATELVDAQSRYFTARLRAGELPEEAAQSIRKIAFTPVPGQESVRPLMLQPGSRPQDLTRERLLWYAAGIGALALAGGILLGVQITRPLHALVAATRRIEQGDYGHTVVVNSKDEIGALANSFNAMSLTLQRNTESRKRMIADIAHELRTPVTGLRCQLEALGDGVTSYSPARLQGLLGDTLQLQRLIEDLQEVSQAEAGQLRIETASCDIRQILDAAAAIPQGGEKGLRVEIKCDSNLPAISTDPIRLRQILDNLLSNAETHSPEGGLIRLAAQAAENRLEITVTDQGPGIAPEYHEKVFERFYRVDDHRGRHSGGSGLGLAIARQLARLLGGNLEVVDSAGTGTAMRITLPLVT